MVKSIAGYKRRRRDTRHDHGETDARHCRAQGRTGDTPFTSVTGDMRRDIFLMHRQRQLREQQQSDKDKK